MDGHPALDVLLDLGAKRAPADRELDPDGDGTVGGHGHAGPSRLQREQGGLGRVCVGRQGPAGLPGRNCFLYRVPDQ
eukprot:gene17468-35955_t